MQSGASDISPQVQILFELFICTDTWKYHCLDQPEFPEQKRAAV
jgi:hypothetical protein